MQSQMCVATPRSNSLLGNGFYSSFCSECCEEDGPAQIRGGFGDDDIDSGYQSQHDSELDEVAVADMAAEYAAEQNLVDQVRREEEEEEEAAKDFPADNQAEPKVVRVPDSVAELDIDDDEDFDVDGEGGALAFTETADKKRPDGYMQEFCYEVFNRLKIEFKKIGLDTLGTNRWLKEHLKRNDYWILPCHMASIAKRLGLKPRHKSYYKRIFVWLPHDRWGEEAMPRCPNCRSNKRVGSHGFQSNHYGRMVVDMHENYFIMTRRYICHSCKAACQASIKSATTAQARGVQAASWAREA